MATIDSYYHELDNICRLCLKHEDPMSLIFETTDLENDENFLVQKINSITSVEVKYNDGLPNSICQACLFQVDEFYNFRNLVEVSDRTLRSCLKLSQTDAADLDVEVDEVESKDQNKCTDASTRNNFKDILTSVTSEDRVVLIQTKDGIRLTKMCNAGEAYIVQEEETRETLEEKLRNAESVKCSRETGDSKFDDLEDIQCFMRKENTDTDTATERLWAVYTCEYCKDIFLTSELLTRHLTIHVQNNEDAGDMNSSENVQLCQLCSRKFESLSDLKVHVSQHSLDKRERVPNEKENKDTIEEQDEPYGDTHEDCLDGDLSSDGNVYNEDDAERNTEEYIICTPLQEYFPEKQEKSSCFKPLRTKSIKCTYCGETFVTVNLKREHEESHPQNKQCIMCGLIFAKKSELKDHESEHAHAPSLCTLCNKQFLNVQSFKMHMRRHALGTRYVCKICGKRYYTNSELARHVQLHSGERQFPCHLCETSFLSRPELNRHLKYHSGEKKFRCKICFKAYYESSHLKIHERVHTGEKPFVCGVCNKGFTAKPKLVRHEKIHTKDHLIVSEVLP